MEFDPYRPPKLSEQENGQSEQYPKDEQSVDGMFFWIMMVNFIALGGFMLIAILVLVFYSIW